MALQLPGADPGSTGPHPLPLNNYTTALVLRLDLLHPTVSGNKWYKLRPYLEEAQRLGRRTLVTWGGPWSNHLLATAAAAAAFGLRSVGLVRGEAPPLTSPTLQECAALGMELNFLSRTDYRTGIVPEDVGLEPGEAMLIPEGGYGPGGAAGAGAMLAGIDPHSYTHIVAAGGTGTMLTGLVLAAPPGKIVIGVPVLRPEAGLAGAVEALMRTCQGTSQPAQNAEWQLLAGYTFGGYARTPTHLVDYMNDLYRRTGILTDRVYTAKLFYAAEAEARPGGLLHGSRPLIIHSGGLQGNRSLPEGSLIFPAP